MSKKFKLADTAAPSTSQEMKATNWTLCILCQEDNDSALTCPANTTRRDVDIGTGYSSMASNLIKFHELGELPRTVQLDRLDDGQGLEKTLSTNKAKWHKNCSLQYNNQSLERTLKRCEQSKLFDELQTVGSKRTRSQSLETDRVKLKSDLCFLCGKSDDNDKLHDASTFEMDERVRKSATIVGDNDLLARLSMGDMVALEAKYHNKCLSSLHSKAKYCEQGQKQDTEKQRVSAIIFAELIMYIEEQHQSLGVSYVFKLSDLVTLYNSRMSDFGLGNDSYVHSTRLKDKLLTYFPDLQAHTKGREVLMVFKENVGDALTKAYKHDLEDDAVIVARAARIVRRAMFDNTASSKFSGSFSSNCQENSVPRLLTTLVSMILEGTSITDQSDEHISRPALTIAQLLKFNSIKRRREHSDTVVRHQSSQETPLPVYIGLMVHARTRKQELVNDLAHLGLSISYDRVLRISTSMADAVLRQYHTEQVVCPLSMCENTFTTAAVDNIDHNLSSTTAKNSFHGTGISLMQHPETPNASTCPQMVISDSNKSTIVGNLPRYYTEVRPIVSNIKGSPIPPMRADTLERGNHHKQEEYEWLEHARIVIETKDSECQNISWAAYHADKDSEKECIITPTALLPLFDHNAHSVAMIKHAMDVVKAAVNHINPNQTPVLVFDQPLYTIAKQIQWKWADYGEDTFVILFGGLHIELAALKTVGDWLMGSGWVQAYIKAKIATDGTAEALLHVHHIARTRRAYQVTAAALYMLQHQAYDRYVLAAQSDMSFESWSDMRCSASPQFTYWNIVLGLQLCVLVFVRSLRQGSFAMYLDSLTELCAWFFAMDHTHYARWISVHLRDMAELPHMHQDVFTHFLNGRFVVQKTHRVFSSMALDQAHEQNNATIKGDGGAVGLMDNPAAFRRWMIAGPEVARVIGEFEHSCKLVGKKRETRHHDQLPGVQRDFSADVRSLVDTFNDLGNPFDEESGDLMVLHTKEIAGDAAVETVRNVTKIGQQQFATFTKERLVDRTKPIEDVISRNKMSPFNQKTRKTTSKGKKLISLKKEVELFSRLYISCQNRQGNLDEFFQHENQLPLHLPSQKMANCDSVKSTSF